MKYNILKYNIFSNKKVILKHFHESYNIHDTQYSLRLQAIEILNEQMYRLNIRPFQSKGTLDWVYGLTFFLCNEYPVTNQKQSAFYVVRN